MNVDLVGTWNTILEDLVLSAGLTLVGNEIRVGSLTFPADEVLFEASGFLRSIQQGPQCRLCRTVTFHESGLCTDCEDWRLNHRLEPKTRTQCNAAFWVALLSRDGTTIRRAAHHCCDVGLDLSQLLQAQLETVEHGVLRLMRLIALQVFQVRGGEVAP